MLGGIEELCGDFRCNDPRCRITAAFARRMSLVGDDVSRHVGGVSRDPLARVGTHWTRDAHGIAERGPVTPSALSGQEKEESTASRDSERQRCRGHDPSGRARFHRTRHVLHPNHPERRGEQLREGDEQRGSTDKKGQRDEGFSHGGTGCEHYRPLAVVEVHDAAGADGRGESNAVRDARFFDVATAFCRNHGVSAGWSCDHDGCSVSALRAERYSRPDADIGSESRARPDDQSDRTVAVELDAAANHERTAIERQYACKRPRAGAAYESWGGWPVSTVVARAVALLTIQEISTTKGRRASHG